MRNLALSLVLVGAAPAAWAGNVGSSPMSNGSGLNGSGSNGRVTGNGSSTLDNRSGSFAKGNGVTGGSITGSGSNGPMFPKGNGVTGGSITGGGGVNGNGSGMSRALGGGTAG